MPSVSKAHSDTGVAFQDAILKKRSTDNLVLTSHDENSGLRQGWRIVTIAGKIDKRFQNGGRFDEHGCLGVYQ